MTVTNSQRTRSSTRPVAVLVPLATHATVLRWSSALSSTSTRLCTTLPPCSAAVRRCRSVTLTSLDSGRPSPVVVHHDRRAGGLAVSVWQVRVAVEAARRTAGETMIRALRGPTTSPPAYNRQDSLRVTWSVRWFVGV